MKIHLRPLTPEDEPFLWEMLYHALHVPAGHSPFPREVIHLPEIARYVQNWGKTGDCGFIAAPEQPVGAVWLRLFTGETGGYGYVAAEIPELSMAVLPGYRGRGIGTELLDRLFDSPCGSSPASLSVSADNRALHLYTRYGFEVVSENAGSLTMVRGGAFPSGV